MKRKVRSLSVRQILFGISGTAAFLICLVLWASASLLSESRMDQQMANRWSQKKDVAQISCFFSANAAMSTDEIEMFRHSLDSALVEASVTQESPNAGARLWADAYSADGRITLKSDRASLEADAVGIGGDFFLFHPLPLISGSYFSGNDLNQDFCVIDEDAAWQLFGSSDVAGMMITIQDIPHIITGVVHREEGHLAESAGLKSTVVYVSYPTLSELGSNNGINHYEIVMPNPVSKFAYNYVTENIGPKENDVEIVENTTRFNLLERLKLIGAFGTRSMNGKAIIYPYWENMARGMEDILSLLTLLSLLFLCYPLILLLICLIKWWKHKNWTIKSVFLYLQDKTERQMEQIREKRKQKGEQHKESDSHTIHSGKKRMPRLRRKKKDKL